MKLKHCDTKPSTRSILEFNEDDVITALKVYAATQGYKFLEGKGCEVCFPQIDSYPQFKSPTTLVIDCDGTEHGIDK